jgi:four helix bundle protein
MIKSFEDLKIWQEAHRLTLEVYKLTGKFPSEERYSLISQVRRSASSVGANIVEGFSRNTTKEFIQFLYNARGSLEETIYHFLLARDLCYLKEDKYLNIRNDYNRLARSINALINSLKNKIK